MVIVLSNAEKKLKQFLNLFWLRPENGLLCTFKSEIIKDVKFETPSLDLSCGDGLFMFLHQGGELDDGVDYFQSTSADNFKHSSFVDIFDHYNENYEVKITKNPSNNLNYGTDWKKDLLSKAEKLNFYENLLVHDNNQVPLPFEDNFFQTIYSNSIYWIKNVRNLSKDIHRILKPGGTVVLEVATPYFYQLIDELEEILSQDAIKILDRNRRETSHGLKTFEEWKKIFEESQFKIEDIRCIYPDKLLLDIWNIGLRPIAHLLIQMSEELDKEKRSKIKNEWVNIFYELFKPLLYLKQTYTMEKAPYLLFILKKK